MRLRLARLAVAEADPALLVADHDQRREPEAPAALHHLGDAVDVDELVGELAVPLFPLAMMFTCHDEYPFPFGPQPSPILRSSEMSATFRTAPQKLSPPSRAASASALTRP
jgi:hypothetical protein